MIEITDEATTIGREVAIYIDSRRENKWRVGVWQGGIEQYFASFAFEHVADRWASDMRAVYRKHDVKDIFIKKEQVNAIRTESVGAKPEIHATISLVVSNPQR